MESSESPVIGLRTAEWKGGENENDESLRQRRWELTMILIYALVSSCGCTQLTLLRAQKRATSFPPLWFLLHRQGPTRPAHHVKSSHWRNMKCSVSPLSSLALLLVGLHYALNRNLVRRRGQCVCHLNYTYNRQLTQAKEHTSCPLVY